MPSSDKQLAFPVKNAASCELPNKGASVVNMSQGTNPLTKDKGLATDPGKAVGAKRLQTDAPSSPGYHNVYVRKKVETEHSKVNSSQELKGNGRDKTKEQEAQQNVQHDQTNKPEVASSPIAESGGLVSSESPAKPNVESVHEKNEPPKPIASSTTVQGDIHRSSNQYWNERFNRLQTYLENCDRSSFSTLIPVLSSLSADGRSMHAIELEKRAIHLLVEEGKELQRMKTLNVLRKVSPNCSSMQTPLKRQCQK